MAQQQQHDCESDDRHRHMFEAETEGDCQVHCELEDDPNDGTTLTIEIENKTPSTFWLYISPNSGTNNTKVKPSDMECKRIDPKSTEPFDFLLWHQGQAGQSDIVDVNVEFNRNYDDCDSNPVRKNMNVNLRPDFDYA